MAYELGKDWRIAIGDGESSEAFDLIGGEGSFDWTRQSQEIDLGTKDDSDYALGDFGITRITFNVSGKLKLPDDGLERAFAVSKSASKRVNWQVKKNSVIKYAGQVAIGNFSMSAPTEGPATYSFTAIASAVPTTDNIGASA